MASVSAVGDFPSLVNAGTIRFMSPPDVGTWVYDNATRAYVNMDSSITFKDLVALGAQTQITVNTTTMGVPVYAPMPIIPDAPVVPPTKPVFVAPGKMPRKILLDD